MVKESIGRMGMIEIDGIILLAISFFVAFIVAVSFVILGQPLEDNNESEEESNDKSKTL